MASSPLLEKVKTVTRDTATTAASRYRYALEQLERQLETFKNERHG